MKKLYKVASALNIKTEVIKSLIDNNKVNYELKSGVYYVDQNEVSEAHRLNRNYFVRVTVDNFKLDYNDSMSEPYRGRLDFNLMGMFIKNWEKEKCWLNRSLKDVVITDYEGDDFDDVTLFVDIGNCYIEDVLDDLRGMSIPEFREVDEDDLSPSDYRFCYGSGEWNYVGLNCRINFEEYGFVENTTLVS